MIKLQTLLIIISILWIFSTCKQNYQEIPESEPVPFYTIDVENLTESIDLKLSDLADTFSLVRLETKDECLLDNQTQYFVYDNYILAYGRKWVYKFSTDGKFIKRLFGVGRGPNEFAGLVGFSTFRVDENQDKLYIYEQYHRSKLFVYDLKSDKFINPIKKFIEGSGGFYVDDDTTLISAVFNSQDKTYYAVYYQNLKGDLISAISHNKVYIRKNIQIPRNGYLWKSGINYYFNFSYTDTLYQITKNKLTPLLALKFKTPGEFFSNSNVSRVGDRFITYAIQKPNFIKIDISTIVKEIWYSSSAGDTERRNAYLFIDMPTGKASKIKTYTDNLINEVQDVSKISESDNKYLKFPSIQSNGIVVNTYNPIQILKSLQNDFTPPYCYNNVYTKLKELSLNIQETDNPILLIGRRISLNKK